jgi:hypothetical protein
LRELEAENASCERPHSRYAVIALLHNLTNTTSRSERVVRRHRMLPAAADRGDSAVLFVVTMLRLWRGWRRDCRCRETGR